MKTDLIIIAFGCFFIGVLAHFVFIDVKSAVNPVIIDHNVVVITIDSITKVPIDTISFTLTDTIR